MTAGIDEILITSGSGQALELINQVMCVPCDTVIMKEYTYQGAMNRLQARGINIVGAKLDDGGLETELVGADGGLVATGAGADHEDVVGSVRHGLRGEGG